MSCQHPNCSHSIQSICTNHCHWSLCQEHLNEHTKCLHIEFEKVLQDLIKPTNELSKSIEQTKNTLNDYQQNEYHLLEQKHQKQLNKIEQKLIKSKQLKEQYHEKLEHLNKIKTNQDILTQNDFQQIDILLKELNQYKTSTNDEIDDKKLVTLEKLVPIEKPNVVKESDPFLKKARYLRGTCPLTSYNIYGLTPLHNTRLCSPEKKSIRILLEHFRNYHHLKIDYANELVRAIMLDLDPMKTKIFPSDTNIMVEDDRQPCPLHDTSSKSGIRGTPCTSMLTDRVVKQHLTTLHRLPLSKIRKILKET